MKLHPPLVTVVVVSYNHSRFLRDCLESVVAQTYNHIQIIIVDNASTDNSRDIIEKFCVNVRFDNDYKTFSKIFAKVNAHLTGAIMESCASIKGSYVIFVDGDDYLLPGCVETHIKAHLVSRVAVGLSSVDMYQCRGDDIVVGTGKPVSDFVMSKRGQTKDFCRMANLAPFAFGAATPEVELRASDLHLVEPAMANEWVWSPTSGLCFRREAIELMLAEWPNLLGGTDNYLVRGISALMGGITIDRAMAVYRLHDNNMFSKHPSLANFETFDRKQLEQLDDEVMTAILQCYKLQTHLLADKLINKDMYIFAIDLISRISTKMRQRKKMSSFTLHYLFDNKELLKECFGSRRYYRWLLRYLRPTDLLKLRWRGRLAKM